MLNASLALLLATSAPMNDAVQDEALRALQLTDVSVTRLDLPNTIDAGVFVEVQLDGLPFTLDLQPFSVRSADYRLYVERDGVLTEAAPGPERTLRGSLVEDPGSLVAASLLDDGLHAKVQTASGDVYWIEPLLGVAPSATFGHHAVYHGDDILCGGGTCGTVDEGPDFVPPPENNPADAGGVYTAELAVEGDYPFYQAYGSNVQSAESRMATVINTMNTQYEDEVRITHVISATIVRTTPGTYTTSDPGALLFQVRTEWTTNQTHVHRDVVQMFTGRNLDGSVIGIAFGPGICSLGTGYNIVQNWGNLGCATDLSAHELGHTWSAGHCSCSGYTMNPSLTCANRFQDDIIEPQILSHRDSRTCLDPPYDGDVLYADDFESGNFTPGGWTISNPLRVKVKKNSAFEGIYGAKLKKGGQGTPACTVGNLETWMEAPPIDTTGYANVQVIMFAHVRNNTLGCENLDLQWWDGGGWQSVAIVEKHAWDFYSFDLPAGAANNPALRLRLITNCKGQAERGEVDNFCVIGQL